MIQECCSMGTGIAEELHRTLRQSLEGERDTARWVNYMERAGTRAMELEGISYHPKPNIMRGLYYKLAKTWAKLPRKQGAWTLLCEIEGL